MKILRINACFSFKLFYGYFVPRNRELHATMKLVKVQIDIVRMDFCAL